MIIIRQKQYSFGRFFEGFGNDKWDPSRSTGGVNPKLAQEAKKYEMLPDSILFRPIESVKIKKKKVSPSMQHVRDKFLKRVKK